MLRALLISGRNVLFFLGAVTLLREAGPILGPPAIIAILLVAAAAVYWQVRARDFRDEQVSSGLLLVLFFLLFGVLAYSRALADQSGFTVRYDYVIELDRALFGAVPTVWLQGQLHTEGGINLLDVLASVIYFSYFVVPVVVGTILWHLNPTVFRLYLSTTIVMIAIGSLTFTLLPTAPPWLAGLDGYLPAVSRIAPEVAEVVRPGFYDRGYQAVGVNDVAAFPSYHTAQTLAVALVASRFGRRPAIGGALYLAAMGFSLVYLGEHYASDVFAGIALGSFAWFAALKLTPRPVQRPAAIASPVPAEPLHRAA